eukprot:scaffold15922_cov66-Cyclotella_meneghiniana.AAC.9
MFLIFVRLSFCFGFAPAGFLVHHSTQLHSNQSVNHGSGDYHYNQQPRGNSFISQVSKRDLEERRQFRSQSHQWQTQAHVQQQQPPVPQQPVAPAQPAQHAQISNANEFDSIATNIKAMTSLLGDVKESLTAQTSDIRWLNQKYQEIEKRLDRAEIFNAAISQDLSEIKSVSKNTDSSSRFDSRDSERDRQRRDDEDRNEKDILYKKLDMIRDQMNRLDVAIKVGEVKMEDIDKKFESIRNTNIYDVRQNNQNQYSQEYSPSPQENSGQNQQFQQTGPNTINAQFNQPQLNNINPPFEQPHPNDVNQPFRQPQPPPFQPIGPHPENFHEEPFRMGSFRYEAPRMGRSYEIPSSTQSLQSQSSANYNNQRGNRSFISSISEQELSQRRELFEPVLPNDGPVGFFGDEFEDFYPDEPFLELGGYFDEGLYGY